MAHGVAQLHGALVTALTGLTTTGANIFDDEITTIPEANLPALRVLDNGRESIDNATMSLPRTQLRSVEFTVRALAKAADAKGVLNTIAAEVETALYANRTLGGKARDLRVTSIDKTYSDESDQRVGAFDMVVVVDWVALEGVPQIPT